MDDYDLGDSVINFIIEHGLVYADREFSSALIWDQGANAKLGKFLFDSAFKLDGHMFGVPLKEWNEVRISSMKRGIDLRDLARWIESRGK